MNSAFGDRLELVRFALACLAAESAGERLPEVPVRPPGGDGAEYAGEYTDGSESVRVSAGPGGPRLRSGGRVAALIPSGAPDGFAVDHPDLDRFPIRFLREDGVVTGADWGDRVAPQRALRRRRRVRASGRLVGLSGPVRVVEPVAARLPGAAFAAGGCGSRSPARRRPTPKATASSSPCRTAPSAWASRGRPTGCRSTWSWTGRPSARCSTLRRTTGRPCPELRAGPRGTRRRRCARRSRTSSTAQGGSAPGAPRSSRSRGRSRGPGVS